MAGLNKVLKNLNNWAVEKRAGIEAISAVTAANATNYAKSNKRWKDITGNARAGLHGGYFWENPEILKAFVAHSMEYGIYLELANESKYAILMESIKKFQNTWYNSVKRIIEK